MEDRAEDERDRLSVGQLAAAAGMTAKALRHYDRIGLFAPDDVDGDTGYRWYGARTSAHGARRAPARRGPLQRRLGAPGDRGTHPGAGRPDAAHGARLP